MHISGTVRTAGRTSGWPSTTEAGCILNRVYVRNYSTQPFDDTWLSGNYYLKSTAGRWDQVNLRWQVDSVTSLCVDAGNPGYSLGSEPASSSNVRINMGNYGGGIRATKTPAGWRPLSDMTNDGIVDFKDVDAFCDYWLDTGSDLAGDLNRNSTVDFADFAKIASQWYLESTWH